MARFALDENAAHTWLKTVIADNAKGIETALPALDAQWPYKDTHQYATLISLIDDAQEAGVLISDIGATAAFSYELGENGHDEFLFTVALPFGQDKPLRLVSENIDELRFFNGPSIGKDAAVEALLLAVRECNVVIGTLANFLTTTVQDALALSKATN